ncbi:MAG TPA: helix-turn-helix domain-containing protein [Acidimicrobiales bacterium]|nr:helix-turn-helix domain-containing protein [Acidimicrobiales bacterium]
MVDTNTPAFQSTGASVADSAPDDAAHSAETDDDAAFSQTVGARLRAVRRQRGMSLADVEDRSEGRWSASALGAYERGFRNITVPRLHALAEYYDVPMAVLLGEPVANAAPLNPQAIVLDLEALRRNAADLPIMAFVNSIVVARGDFNGRVLSLRSDDLRALCALVGAESVGDGVQTLRDWGVLIGVANPSTIDDPGGDVGDADG